MQAAAVVLLLILFLFFPLWVAVQAWRKDYKKWSMVISISFLIPLAPTILAAIVFVLVRAWEPEWDSSPNPSSYIGCGTMFYGALGREGDGSFITTLWFCILFIPLIPIQSYRVIRSHESSDWQGVIITTRKYFFIKEALTLNAFQLIITYGFFLSFVALAIIMINSMPSAELFMNMLGGLAIVYLIVGYFLLRTK